MTKLISAPVADFAAQVGGLGDGPVAVRGGATSWAVGGQSTAGTRIVQPPAGVVTFEPAEMTVRVLAGTTVAELDAVLAAAGQTTILAGPPGATVGGVLSVGRDPVGVARWGKLRDVLLQAIYVAADGRVIKAGGPTVKNVTGYDLCRVLVGALGTLGCVADVILRTRPVPEATQWFAGTVSAPTVTAALYRPLAVFHDGSRTWAGLEGYAVDVAAQAAVARALGMNEVSGPPDPTTLPTSPTKRPSAAVMALQLRLRDEFDPTRRLNPGREPLAFE